VVKKTHGVREHHIGILNKDARNLETRTQLTYLEAILSGAGLSTEQDDHAVRLGRDKACRKELSNFEL
jgi:hypothetical protein